MIPLKLKDELIFEVPRATKGTTPSPTCCAGTATKNARPPRRAARSSERDESTDGLKAVRYENPRYEDAALARARRPPVPVAWPSPSLARARRSPMPVACRPRRSPMPVAWPSPPLAHARRLAVPTARPS